MCESRAVRGFYAIVDPELCAGRDPRRVAAQILEGGCALLQLRDKRPASDPALAELAAELLALCAQAGVPFVINDHVALAARLGAWGVHLGQGDLPLPEARALAPGLKLGLSTHDPAQAQAALASGADLIGFGPVFPTRSKERPDPVVGVDTLRQVSSAIPLPVVAIGGIGLAELPAVIAAGASLVAAIGAVTGAADPRAAARAFHQALTR
jgi:thiamine-phosphate pyrophosphorylase